MHRLKTLWAREELRFLIIGGFNTVLGYALFAVIQWMLGAVITYLGSLILSHLVASLLAFLLYRKLVFRVTGKAWLDFLRFQLVYAGSFGANLVLLPLLVSGLSWNPYIAQAAAVIIIAVSSYIGHKWFSFNRKENT